MKRKCLEKTDSPVKALKKRRSIKMQILLSMVTLTLVTLAIIWIFQIFFLGVLYTQTKENALASTAERIEENVNSEDLDSFFEREMYKQDCCGLLLNMSDSSATVDTHFWNHCMLHSVDIESSLIQEWYTQASENGGTYKYKYNQRDFATDMGADIPDNFECLVHVSLIEGDGVTYMLLLDSYSQPVSPIVNAIRLLATLISIFLVVISVILSYILSKRIALPVEKMTQQAKSITMTNYSIKFDEDNGSSELNQLAKSLNQATEELAKLDQMQKELISNISHDLRTPLTMITGYSEVMRDIPGENTPENTQVIIDEAQRLTSLVNDLLNVSKLQSGTQVMNMVKINLTNVINQTIKRYDKLITHNGYKITFEHDSDVFVVADEIRLLQVVYNLINNAINYTGEDKTIRVTQEVNDGVVKISVIDTGEGIKEEDLPFIWDRYFKVDKVHKRATIGTGLGLSIVKNILLLHGSRFGVASEVGEGSCFWFELKIAE